MRDPAIRSPFLKNILIYFLPSASVLSLLLVAAGVFHYSVFTFIFLLNLLIVSAGLKKTQYNPQDPDRNA